MYSGDSGATNCYFNNDICNVEDEYKLGRSTQQLTSSSFFEKLKTNGFSPELWTKKANDKENGIAYYPSLGENNVVPVKYTTGLSFEITDDSTLTYGEKITFNAKALVNFVTDEQPISAEDTEAQAVAADGEMFFGGHRGYNSFYPENQQEQPFSSSVIVTDIKIFNQSWGNLPAKERMEISELSPAFADEIQLDHWHNNFSIEFSALEYANPERNQYAYQLAGFDSDWQYTGGAKRFAYYNNLKPGTYTFQLKASNANGIWDDEMLRKCDIVDCFCVLCHGIVCRNVTTSAYLIRTLTINRTDIIGIGSGKLFVADTVLIQVFFKLGCLIFGVCLCRAVKYCDMLCIRIELYEHILLLIKRSQIGCTGDISSGCTTPVTDLQSRYPESFQISIPSNKSPLSAYLLEKKQLSILILRVLPKRLGRVISVTSSL